MAVCPSCTREMRDSVSCTIDPFIIGAKLYEPLPWGRERRVGRRPIDFRVPRLCDTTRRDPSPWV